MTHVTFDPDSIDWSPYLNRQQIGHGFRMSGRGEPEDENKHVFKGMRYTRGYGSIKGVLGSIGRFLMPIASNLAETAKSEAKSTLGRVSADIAQGKPLLGTITENARTGLTNVGQKIQQCGKGKKRRPKNTPRKLFRDVVEVNPTGLNSSPSVYAKTKPLKVGSKRKLDYLDF